MKVTGEVVFDSGDKNWESYYEIIIKFVDENLEYCFMAYMKGRNRKDHEKRILFKKRDDVPRLPFYIDDLNKLKCGGPNSENKPTTEVIFDGDDNMITDNDPKFIKENGNYYIKDCTMTLKCTENDIDQVCIALNDCIDKLLLYGNRKNENQ